MRYLKNFEAMEKFDLVEAWEVDDNNEITGNSVWPNPEQLELLKKLNLIFFDLVADKYGSFPIYYEKDSDEVEKNMELISQSKKYNL